MAATGRQRSQAAQALAEYTIEEDIGTGTFGTCRRVRRNADGAVMVWKELNYGAMTEREKQMLVSEVNILRELQHPNIVRYYDRIIDRTNTTIYIIMEYCAAGDLASLIKERRRARQHLNEKFVQKMLHNISAALLECHRRKDGPIMHRDLKPANIFLDHEQTAKLGDFGLARVLASTHSLATTFVGTPYYMSPEQITEKAYNEKSDIWSLGCIVYELAALRPPFDAIDQASLAVKIRAGHFDPLPSQYSRELNALVCRMLQQRCEDRPSVQDICQNPYALRADLTARIDAPASAAEALPTAPESRIARTRPSPLPSPPSRHTSDVFLLPPPASPVTTPSVLPVAAANTTYYSRLYSDISSLSGESPAGTSPTRSTEALLRSLELREAALAAKARALATKEGELTLRERDLERREEALRRRERLQDVPRVPLPSTPAPASHHASLQSTTTTTPPPRLRPYQRHRYSSSDITYPAPLTPISGNILSPLPRTRTKPLTSPAASRSLSSIVK